MEKVVRPVPHWRVSMADEQGWRWVVPIGRVVLFGVAIGIAIVRAVTGSVDAVTISLLALAAFLLLYDQVERLSLLGFKASGIKKARRQVDAEVVAESGGPAAELRAARSDLDRASQELAVAYGFAQGATATDTIKAAVQLKLLKPGAAQMAEELAKVYVQADGSKAKKVTPGLASDFVLETSMLVGVLRRVARAAPANPGQSGD
jgi:hypothetical protein